MFRQYFIILPADSQGGIMKIMLDVNYIRTEPDKVKIGLKAKNVTPSLVDDFLALDENWRNTTKEYDDLRARLNALSKERKIDEAKVVKGKIKELEGDLPKMEQSRDELLNRFPNIPFPDWPVGKDESENKVLRSEEHTSELQSHVNLVCRLL